LTVTEIEGPPTLQPRVIDNRSGAAGPVGAEIGARSVPDGYTLLMTNPGSNVRQPLVDCVRP
jgi:hypothetical protein